ncbi:ribosomal protein S18 acetylase RimI-like enzyme [Humibacillus xanthopallidus]|uniref:Ribosomal protein S18 acetylase RimI-like enzyme n=1 Tax=Humibacillus xanthopallidus TaxID=412689 RepID=A0A543PY46_9MICO|nr:GNAT family N-acetyltransferase [Humibacillus xanthopallidus]TQN48961.1 ribosomal protein S18 acetylase RimI-like enzyme [Humibacillus xanthopallidus]
MSADFEIRPIDLLDDNCLPDAERWTGIHAAVQRELFGDRGSSWTLEEIRAFHRSGEKLRVPRAAWRGGEMVGALDVIMPRADNTSLALLWLSVDPAHRGWGFGSALLAEAERLGAAHGRSVFNAETEWAHGAADLSEGFARAHGFAIGLTMLRSDMALPADRDAVAAVLSGDGAGDGAGAGSGAGDDYGFESFVDHMPQEWLEDRAVLQQRMSTDAPSDDLDVEEEVWDADRLRASYERSRASGRRIVETVARHLPSGRLVGFTTVSVSAGEPDLAYQQDTLVLREHRGHGLGLRLKAANALRLMDELPEVTSVRTWNAASNTHMLAVNRRLGYTVDGYSREWQKKVGARL